MDELASQVVGPARVEQDHGHFFVDHQPIAFERHEVVGIGGPGPGLDRLRDATGADREIADRDAVPTRLRIRRKRPSSSPR